jgi:hypothetical protein
VEPLCTFTAWGRELLALKKRGPPFALAALRLVPEKARLGRMVGKGLRLAGEVGLRVQ